MGTVYKAHHRELEGGVALKALRGEFTRHSEIAKRFRFEIKLAGRIRQKNLCGIHEYDWERALLAKGVSLVEKAFNATSLAQVVRTALEDG
jgi:serine/threonine protein kinase